MNRRIFIRKNLYQFLLPIKKSFAYAFSLMWKVFIFLFALSYLQSQETILQIGKATVTVEIANTPELMHKGLSGRALLAEGKGMLFIYDRPQKLSFWMKDTHFPLSIGFFDENRVLFQIEDMNLPSEGKLPVYNSRRACRYALEVAQGWFRQNNIKPGMKFSLSEIESIR